MLPEVEAFAKSANGKYHVISILTQEKQELDQFFNVVTKPTFPLLLDPDGAVSGSYSVPALPTFVILDKSGVVQHVTVGVGRYFKEASDNVLNMSK